MTSRFNPAPGWPTPPIGFNPGPGWQPDVTWPPAPAGWPVWVDENGAPAEPPLAFPYAESMVPAATERQTSKLAIAAFVLGLIGLVLFAVGFGIVALRKISGTNQKG